MKVWIKVAVTTLVLGAIFYFVPWDRLWNAARQLEPAVWFGVFACFIAGHALGVFKWRLNVNLGHANLGAVDAVQCYSAGMFANLCLPSIVGGDALKALLAGKLTSRFEAAVIGGVTERLIDTAALLVLLVIGALTCHSVVPGWAERVLLVGVMLALGGALLCLPLLFRTKLERWPRKLRRTVGRSLVATRRLARRPHVALFVFAMSLAIQSWFVLLNSWLGRGIGIDVPMSVWFFAVPMAKVVTLAPISLGGFGVREATLGGLLLALANVTKEQGIAASLLWQTVLVATGLVGGALWFALGFRRSARTGGGRDSIFAPLATPESKHG